MRFRVDSAMLALDIPVGASAEANGAKAALWFFGRRRAMGLRIAPFRDPIHKTGASVPRVVQVEIISYDELIRRTSARAGQKPARVRAVVDETIDTVVGLLSEGGQVRTPIGTFTLNVHRRPPVAGRNGSKARPRRRNCDKYSVSISLRPARALTRRVQQGTTIETAPAPDLKVPVIVAATNLDGDDRRGSSCPDAVLHIAGSRLSFRPADAETGVFFVSFDSDRQSRASLYSRCGSRLVDCWIPALMTGR